RPDPEDPGNPDVCVLEMISLLHFGKDKGKGKQPPLAQVDDVVDDWKNQRERIPKLLLQDLINMEEVQRGMHSVGLKGLRPNPVQEVQISNFHRVINEYLFG